MGLEGWTVGGSGYEMAVLVVTAMFALAGIALGTGIGFRIRWLQDWGRDELIQTAINGAMVGVLVLLFGSAGILTLAMNGLINEKDFVMGNPDAQIIKIQACSDLGATTPICYALIYNVILQKLLISVIGTLSILVFLIGFLAELSLDLVFVAIKPFAGLEPLVGVFSNMMQLMVMLLTMNWVQFYFLKFVENVAIPVFLPLGLILRSFFMTRKLGGAIIAIAIGLGVVFPLTFVLDGAAMTENIKNPADEVNAAVADIQTTITEITDLEGLFTSPGLGIMVPNIGEIKNRIEKFGLLFTEFAMMLKGIVEVIQAFIGNMILMVVILPFFNIIVTMVSIRELATLFGSEFSGGGFGSL